MRLVKNQTTGDFLDSCQLFLLPGRCPPNYRHVDFHNQVFKYWKKFWVETFAVNKCRSVPKADIFYRQDLIAVLVDGNNIVGTLFFTENNIASDVTMEIEYFGRTYIHDFCERLRAKGVHSVATYEMLTVNPLYRKRITGVAFGAILLGIIVKVFESLNADLVLGPVRLDNGVCEMVFDFGWELVSEQYLMHGTPVALSVLYRDKIRDSQNKLIQGHVIKFWNEKIDLRFSRASLNQEPQIVA